MKFWAMTFFAVLLALGCTIRQSSSLSGKWVDLSYDFSQETIYWPTSDPFVLDTVFVGITEQGFYYSAYKFCAAEHGGTHIDAPVHFGQGKRPVNEIPLEQLMGPAVVIDVSDKALKNRDYLVGVEDFKAWEQAHGRIPDGAMVFLRTGYGRFWPNREKYMGTAERGPEAVKKLHFPGLAPRAAQWLVENRNIHAVGLDTPSIDYGQSTNFETHQILNGHNIPALENVANLDQLPPTGAWVIALPMKIRGGSGGPVRIIARLPEA
ncbi:MAG: cyclase family protein [Calditrichaeota bacterium]|nr:MAG: cyclase family protein [Calditrichota bacterium]